MSLEPAGWRTSTRSLKRDCVEVGRAATGGAAVRDSKDRSLGYFTTSATQWQTFVTEVKRGTFDR